MKNWKKYAILSAAAVGLSVPQQEINLLIDALK